MVEMNLSTVSVGDTSGFTCWLDVCGHDAYTCGCWYMYGHMHAVTCA